MTCLIATHPWWQYLAMTLAFGVGTFGLAWFARDTWRGRTRWWQTAGAPVLGVLALAGAWLTIAIAVNTVLYAIALAHGLPRC